MRILTSKEFSETLHKTNDVSSIVKNIIQQVRENGDDALIQLANQFDGLDNRPIEISDEDVKQAFLNVPEEVQDALKKAAKNIEIFAQAQKKCLKPLELKTEFGIIGHSIIPIESVGCYIPGGNYPLPSTALMTIIPAKVAGVENIIVCSPHMDDTVIVAAIIAGADKLYRVGGAQAIAAMTYGTNIINSVNKIVGPGNIYVTEAKKQVYGHVGIDFLAGSSELLVLVDNSAKSKLIAADLIAQAEHDILAKVYLLTDSKDLAINVKREIDIQLSDLGTRQIASKSIENGKIILVNNIDEGIEIANFIAPEHLQIHVKQQISSQLVNYGALFLNENSPEVFADYCSGPNHTLPTGKVANFRGGLNVFDFVKICTYQEIDSPTDLIDISSILAETEGLSGHARAARMRSYYD